MKKFYVMSLGLILAVFMFANPSFAQSVTAGDISGVVTDATGAVIPNAQVTVKNVANGDTKVASSSGAGSYRISLLSPGTYSVSATAAGFGTTTGMVTVAAGNVSTDDIHLSVGAAGVTVEVAGAPNQVNTENGDVTTAFTAEQVQALPNPGNDLTFIAQTAPGSVMNTGTTAGGYGNFSSFGVSGLSNMFTLDGGYENDPFLNLNNTGASNLTLGNNEVDTVTVISPAFSSQFGGLGGAQVNEITAAGSNRLHGNLNYYWDGRATNANDYFNKQNEVTTGTQNIPTFVNANQWGAAIGGPILHDRLFFFVNTEGIRAVTPAQGTVYAPNADVQSCTNGAAGSNAAQNNTVIPYDHYILNDEYGTKANPTPFGTSDVSVATYTAYALGAAGYANCGALNVAADTGAAAAYYNSNYNQGAPVPTNNSAQVGFLGDGVAFSAAAPGQLPQMQRVFNTYNTSPFRPAASSISQDPNDPSLSTYFATASQTLTEWLLTARIDYKISDKDNFFIHYKQDKGLQPTYTDLISPLFTAQSPQPAWEGQLNETHNFTANLVNQLVLTGNYYSAPFQNNNSPDAVASAAPSTFEFLTGDNGGTLYGGEDYAFPQGRRVAGYQVIDDVSYTRGRNTVRFGYNIRRDNITDIQEPRTINPLTEGYAEDFWAGVVDYVHSEYFPLRPTQPVAVYDEGFYVENAYKVLPNLTFTAGLRVETNSNPTCITNCFSVLANPVTYPATAAAPTNVPYNAAFPGGLISANRHQAFKQYQKYAPMPRISFNWSPRTNTIIRGGFGMFTDTFPGLIADRLLSNAPDNFHAAVYGPEGPGTTNIGYDPSVASTPTLINGRTTATTSASVFETDFYAGNTETQVASDVGKAGAVYSTPSIQTVAPKVQYPTYEEFSLAVEQRIDNKTTLSATYVGNHGYHEPVGDGSPNLTVGNHTNGSFASVPTAKPFASFATVTNTYSGASSNFNGVVLTATRRSKALTIQFNYEFSKALDEISNGGLEPFAPDAGDSAALVNPGNLHSNYGPADYNVKHNVTSSFVYEMPSFVKSNNLMRNITGGFEFSGDVFHNSGLPYSITQSTTAGGSGIASSFANGGVVLLASKLNNNFDHHCGGSSHVENVALGTVANPCDFTGSFGTPSNFTSGQSRNSLVGPSYTNVNFGAFKTIVMPHFEFMKLKLGAQAFNLFNHTNFQNPAHGRGSSNSTLGGISSTVGAPTSILGSVGGSDATPRLIQLHGSITF